MKIIKLMERLAVVTLLMVMFGNMTYAYTKPNRTVASAASNYKKAASEVAVISEAKLKAELGKIDMAALAAKPEVKALLNRMAKDKAFNTTVNAVMKNNLSGKAKATLLVSAFRPYAGNWWDCVWTCLRSAGVSAYSIILCIGACIISLGAACVLCLGVSGVVTELCAYLCAKEMVQMEEIAN